MIERIGGCLPGRHSPHCLHIPLREIKSLSPKPASNWRHKRKAVAQQFNSNNNQIRSRGAERLPQLCWVTRSRLIERVGGCLPGRHSPHCPPSPTRGVASLSSKPASNWRYKGEAVVYGFLMALAFETERPEPTVSGACAIRPACPIDNFNPENGGQTRCGIVGYVGPGHTDGLENLLAGYVLPRTVFRTAQGQNF